MFSYYIGNKPKYDVEMIYEYNENWRLKNESMYVINKIIVNNPKMYEFYEKQNDKIELVKGFK